MYNINNFNIREAISMVKERIVGTECAGCKEALLGCPFAGIKEQTKGSLRDLKQEACAQIVAQARRQENE